jgi:hypothetical protein
VVRPDGNGATTLTLEIRDVLGRRCVLCEQEVTLPDDDQEHELRLAIDASVAAEAAELAKAVQEKGRR